MKKVLVLMLCGVLVLSSCGTATGTGAYVGGSFGHVIGSAIGGISGGWRGEHWGSLVGTVGGAVAGAAIGAAVDNSQRQKYERAEEARRQRVERQQQENARRDTSYQYDESGYDPQGRGDDRITFDDADPTRSQYNIATAQTMEPSEVNISAFGGYSVQETPTIEIRNARVADANQDWVLTRNEECRVSFEIMNNSDHPIRNVQPAVVETTGNKHVYISPNLNIESIRPHRGVRYTATILADGRLKDGEVKIRIAVSQNNKTIVSQMQELTIPTRKK